MRYYRRQCHDPQRGGWLTQARFAELISHEPGVPGYSSVTISNWEHDENPIHKDDRATLVAIIKVLHTCSGLPGSVEANEFLTAGNYRSLDEDELRQINPAWVAKASEPDVSQQTITPTTEERPIQTTSRPDQGERVARLTRRPVQWKRWSIVGGGIALLILVAIGLSLDRTQDIKRSQRVAAEAQRLLESQPDLALLLALEALRLADTPEAQASLQVGWEATRYVAALLRASTATFSVAFNQENHLLASGHQDGSIIFWDVTAGRSLAELTTGHQGRVWSLAFSPDGQTLVSGGEEGAVVWWDVDSRQMLTSPLARHGGVVTSLAFSPDGQRLASSSADETIQLWNAATHQPLGRPLDEHAEAVWQVVFSPDGRTLASAGADDQVILREAITGYPLEQPPIVQTGDIRSLAFHPQGHLLAIGNTLGHLSLYNLAEQSSEPLSATHAAAVTSLAFDKDGRWLAAGSCRSFNADKVCVGGEVRWWDVMNGRPLDQTFTIGLREWVSAMAFNPREQWLAVASGAEVISLWRTEPRPLPDGNDFSTWQSLVCAITRRSLSEPEWRAYLPGKPQLSCNAEDK
ncbi:MAG: WD40 repeat domain-containing protein [Chloroflexota bacterium]